ncbi:MAG: hypothetical protein QOI58_3728 [Thermoanaerobaculia bacterium]|jgi:predicted nucleic acid-binding OB-fold protein|nr:hypothetical protein [Thermoanaerobaculia bacterium]
MKNRVSLRTDNAIQRIDWLLSRRDLQRSARRELKEVRRQLIRLKSEPDVGDFIAETLKWAAIVASILEVLHKWSS